MQTNGTVSQHNGETLDTLSVPLQNGTTETSMNGGVENKRNPQKTMSKSDMDIIRLIGQHLRGLGLK
ncbi:hypothetical protein DPMN_097619 [Dreissena polymorpha]|uniref:Uncharacterized protein n=1 Tax=Dreissena polymorpha TaxID=45954 RepID=A0A9D4R4W7_DREPO|nr:hypothetical protein DPMN_097619 [Dreissena polymorpha]